jgi:hypothetical protein
MAHKEAQQRHALDVADHHAGQMSQHNDHAHQREMAQFAADNQPKQGS